MLNVHFVIKFLNIWMQQQMTQIGYVAVNAFVFFKEMQILRRRLNHEEDWNLCII